MNTGKKNAKIFLIFFLNNKKINIQETLKRKIILDSKPLILGIIVTDWCNLKCIMCADVRSRNQCTLPASALEKIEELLPYLERIEWQGGEFFHLDYLKELFFSMKRYPHIEHIITTNGLLLDEAWIRLLFDLNVRVYFSIDGPTKEIYEYIRKGANYGQLIKQLNLIINLEQKYKRKLERQLFVVVMKSNYRVLTDFVGFAKKYGFSFVSFMPVRFIDNEENIFKYTNNDIQKCLSENIDLIRSRFVESGIGFHSELPDYHKKLDVVQDNMLKKNSENLFCNLHWKGMFVCADRDGNILPDCWCEQPIGNIFQDSLLEVWNNEKMQEYRKKIVMHDFSLCKQECVKGYSALSKVHVI